MSKTTIGMLLGAILAAFAVNWGFWAFVLAALFIAIGAVLGRTADGKLDLRGVGEALIGKHGTTSD